MDEKPTLNRSVSFSQLFLFGLGTIIGGGFYALLGKIAGFAGIYTPFSFLLAGLIAMFSAFSYAELSSRYPYSAGEARYMENAFRIPWLTKTTGWLVVATGVVSSATLVLASAGFLYDITGLTIFLGVIAVALFLGAVAGIGIRLSMSMIVIITLIEVGSLAFILWNTTDIIGDAATRWTEYIPPMDVSILGGVLGGTLIAFYAFIGFEDMVNISEEVRRVRDHMPWAILGSLIISTIFYVLISISALDLVSIEAIAASNTPLALIMTKWGGLTVFGMALISLLAGLNGALVQIVMASRVVYGLANADRAPRWMADIHPMTRTPLKSTVLVGLIVLALALFFPVVTLAQITSVLILIVFFGVNISLIRIKLHEDKLHKIPEHSHIYPFWIPCMGALTTALILLYSLFAFFTGQATSGHV